MQNVYGPWHKRWWCGSVQEDLCAKSLKHLCKHMASFQPCRQCSHSLKIDVQGNIPCPGAMLEWLWTSEKPWASSNIHFQYSSFAGKQKKNSTHGFYLTLCCSKNPINRTGAEWKCFGHDKNTAVLMMQRYLMVVFTFKGFFLFNSVWKDGGKRDNNRKKRGPSAFVVVL